jgi:hypothetical protein
MLLVVTRSGRPSEVSGGVLVARAWTEPGYPLPRLRLRVTYTVIDPRNPGRTTLPDAMVSDLPGLMAAVGYWLGLVLGSHDPTPPGADVEPITGGGADDEPG